MIIIKEKVKDSPTIIFWLIFDFWAGTMCPVPKMKMQDHFSTQIYPQALSAFIWLNALGAKCNNFCYKAVIFNSQIHFSIT